MAKSKAEGEMLAAENRKMAEFKAAREAKRGKSKQVKVMTCKGKYIKFATLNEALLKALKESESITVKNNV